MPIKLVTRADPRKLILNQKFTLNGYTCMWKKIPAHYQEEEEINLRSVFFLLLLNSSSSSGEPESVLDGGGGGARGRGGWIGGGGGAVLPECLAISVPLWGCTPRITEMVRSFFGCSFYILYMMYNQISLVTFNLILKYWWPFNVKLVKNSINWSKMYDLHTHIIKSYTFTKYFIIWQ